MIKESRERRGLVDQFIAKGLRLTSQRKVLLEVMQSAEEHLDAASLLRLARERDSGVNRATVYRTLELLKKSRLVDELDLMHLNGEKHYYEVRRGHGHIHLACFGCGRIQEFGSPLFEGLKRQIARECGFSISAVRLEVGGRCSDCAHRTEPEPGATG
jgi:Fur family ferric uptake transcriptional regulator